MTKPPFPDNEAGRLAALRSLQILDTPPEERFDRITRLALQHFKVPVALISLMDENRQWFKSYQGLDIKEIPRSVSFCDYAHLTDDLMVVEDTRLDTRFADNPFVVGEPFVRFYAGQKIFHPNGLPVGTLCIIDVVPRKLAENERRSLRDLASLVETELVSSERADVIANYKEAENEVYFQARLLDNVQQSIIATDSSFKIIYWNRFAEKLYGWSQAEAVGQNIQDVLTLATQQDVEAPQATFNELANSTTHSNLAVGEFLMRHRNGTIFPIEAITAPIYDENGRKFGIVGVSTDISRRKQAEQRLAENELRFRSLIENSTDMITLIAPDGSVLYQSPSVKRVMGYSEEDWSNGRSSFEGVHPDDLVALLNTFNELKQHPDSTNSVEFRFRYNQDESWRYIEAIGHNLLHLPGVAALVVNARDVTERRRTAEALKKQEEQLRQACKMEAIGRLTGGIAHDFNNLMTAILGYSELLLADYDEVDATWQENQKHQDLLEIKHTAERATNLTRQLLAFSRKQVLRPEATHIGELMTNLINMLHRLIGENITLQTNIDPNLALVQADPSQLEQIIINLIVNARDAMPMGGSLEIKVFNVFLDEVAVRSYSYNVQSGFYVCLCFKDNGIGMDQETLSHIFEPFYTTKAVNYGTGLGLATVYGIVKQSEGYISVSSEPFVGTEFNIYLPQLPATTSGSLQVEAEDSSKNPAEKKDTDSTHSKPLVEQNTVLIVEDEDKIRQLLGRTLATQKLKVMMAANGADALAQIQGFLGKLDLILTDVVLPDMRGPALIRQSQQYQPKAKVMLMSGYSEEAIASQGELMEGAIFLEKPFDLATFSQKIREALQEQQ